MNESALQHPPERAAGPAAPRDWTAEAVAVILIAGLAAYSNSFKGAFIFDDLPAMEQPAAQHLWPVWRIFAAPRLVVQFTLALNHSLGGVWGYHAFNLAVHILAALTLFGIVRRTLTIYERQKPQISQITQIEEKKRTAPLQSAESAKSAVTSLDKSSVTLALAVALLWMLHPLQTESVTYVIQRMESLMGLFYLLTLYCFIRAATLPGFCCGRRDCFVPPRFARGFG